MRGALVNWILHACLTGALCANPPAPRARSADPAPTPASAPAGIQDPYPDPYGGRRPDFVRMIEEAGYYGGRFRGWQRSEEEMRLSSEPTFFTLNVIEEDARAYALVAAGIAAVLRETRARDAARIPAGGAARRLGAVEIAVANQRHVEPGDRGHLGQEHRAEFAGADQSDAHRFVGVDARGEQRLQVHACTTS